jgi:hypothetical protein
MTTATEPQDLEGLLAAYALGAVEDDERATVEAVIAAEPGAREQLTRFERATELLPSTEGPSPHVWTRIEAAIADDERCAVVVPIDAASGKRSVPRTRRRIVRAVGIAAAVAAALALAVWSIDTIDQSYSTTPAGDVQRAADEAAQADGARRILLTTPAGSTIELVLLPDGRGFVLGGDLPIAPEGLLYQLYGVTDDGQVLLAVIGDRIEATAFQLPSGITDLVLSLGGPSVGERLAVVDAATGAASTPAGSSSQGSTGSTPPNASLPSLPPAAWPSAPIVTLPSVALPSLSLPSLSLPLPLPPLF